MDYEQEFYWVSEGGAEPEIALWQAGEWWLPGSEEPMPSSTIRILGERLQLSSRLPIAA